MKPSFEEFQKNFDPKRSAYPSAAAAYAGYYGLPEPATTMQEAEVNAKWLIGKAEARPPRTLAEKYATAALDDIPRLDIRYVVWANKAARMPSVVKFTDDSCLDYRVQATGMTELMAGQTDKQMRSAAEAAQPAVCMVDENGTLFNAETMKLQLSAALLKELGGYQGVATLIVKTSREGKRLDAATRTLIDLIYG